MRLPLQEGNDLEASWNPELTYIVRIREAGTEAWSFRFETPLTHFSFVDLKPDTEYEMQVCARNASGQGKPQLIRIKTSPIGNTDNVIPFPGR